MRPYCLLTCLASSLLSGNARGSFLDRLVKKNSLREHHYSLVQPKTGFNSNIIITYYLPITKLAYAFPCRLLALARGTFVCKPVGIYANVHLGLR